VAAITRERAERIARSHACENCREYSYKRVSVKPASAAHKAEFNELWHAVAVCGICGAENDLGIDEEGQIIYAG
jgi:hypothetical protein